MTRLIIMIEGVRWQPKNYINSLTFEIKNNCLALNWPLGTIKQILGQFKQKDSYFKDLFVFEIYILIFVYFIIFNFYILII